MIGKVSTNGMVSFRPSFLDKGNPFSGKKLEIKKDCIQAKAKSFYLELADLMDRHGILEIGSVEGCDQAEVRTVRFRYYEHDLILDPKSIRDFVSSCEVVDD